MAIAEWTIMVFLNADNNLEPFGIQDFREMATVGSTNEVNIIVQFDRNGGYATTVPQWQGACRFKIARGMPPDPSQAEAVLGDTNMGSGTTLRQFVDWAMSNYPAKRYMLDIWNHGMGWRAQRLQKPSVAGLDLNRFVEFRARQSSREAARQGARLARGAVPAEAVRTAIPFDTVVPGTIRSVSSDDTSGDFLFNREIQDSLAGLTLDLIGFDACLMATVETAYALRQRAKVMVGSEDLEPGAGWNYANWLGYLVANPTIDALDLGKTLVDSYRNEYSGRDEATTLSVIDLSRMDTLASSIDALSDQLITSSAMDLQAITKARLECDPFAPGYGFHCIDLAHFAGKVVTRATEQSLKVAAQGVVAEVNRSIVQNFAGQDRAGGDFGSTGLSIYFPENQSLFKADPDNAGYMKSNAQYPVEFVQTRHWADFLLTRYLPGS